MPQRRPKDTLEHVIYPIQILDELHGNFVENGRFLRYTGQVEAGLCGTYKNGVTFLQFCIAGNRRNSSLRHSEENVP